MKKTKFAIESEKYAKENPFVEQLGDGIAEITRADISELVDAVKYLTIRQAELARENEELRKALREAKDIIQEMKELWDQDGDSGFPLYEMVEKWLESNGVKII